VLISKPADLHDSDITPKASFLDRRKFLAALPAALLARRAPAATTGRFTELKPSPLSVKDQANPPKDATTYNNYYEFGTRKNQPVENAKDFKTDPWTLTVEGAVKKPRTFSMEEIRRLAPLEERIYRFRCVEGWSMIVPWVGYSLSALLKQVNPTSKAAFVSFETYYDPVQMPLGKNSGLTLPYVEGLRLDEAQHPLALLAIGLYGESLLPQNGAPVRLIVPWKYGFKSGKSLVRIKLLEQQPVTTWNLRKPQEYGFYSNVNPAVDHPRWSQATERRLGELSRHPTLPFNGYADQIASLYQGMDLKVNF
jgi:methionine sulfoxide reductase catalytic subunit